MKPLIVICSKDAEFYLLLSHILEVDGFASTLAGSIDEVLELAAGMPVRAVVLDCRPDNQLGAKSAGLKQDARTGALPCVALVSPGAEAQHIQLLRSGIDECFVRPFAPAKLLEYLRARLAVGQASEQGSRRGKSLAYSDIEMQLDTHRVRCAGKEISLGPIEFKLLRHMLENPEKVLSRDELIAVAWTNSASVSTRVVDVHMSQLRKLLRRSSRSVAIRTVRLAGYALEDQSA
ncbi:MULTISPECIES: response regulator transcription factor [unclassified Mesorhizobium]|uniref:response regulator transcription factor n=1 Tax=unclassified Mesorhizobium TaxID=325217 RepID=UPI001128B92C|nr:MULTISPECIES: response regulator transcription factor [unclassified Mesorhizobium]TPJ39719.1 response regulator transcription factor [Mesorhizobium sp. B2-6-6]MCA0008804.1 response regulator transcription factor [Mesorhizobium sp. B264B1B]MCA0021903.1 response regulator transcription factor [Mesorhizobium sp. B264B1A]MCA0026395.1 response regulator transcription factor [Mesorhizobium sp. B263B1A]MCA0056799.1 response regulator transcription factor [Mesorhizobium sp. B261B1A]